MTYHPFPVIDPAATGANILRLRQARGLSVRDLQHYFGFEEPQAIYKWQRGQSLPTVDNLYALSALLGVPMNEILVPSGVSNLQYMRKEQQAEPAALVILQYRSGRGGHGRIADLLRPLSAASRTPPPRRAADRRGRGDLSFMRPTGRSQADPWAEA